MRSWVIGGASLCMLAVLVVLGSKLGVGPAVVGDGRAESHPGDVLLAEEFTSASLGPEWTTCFWWARDGCTIGSNNELQWYLPDQLRIRDGAARLRAERRRTVAPDGVTYRFTSGLITTGPPDADSDAGFAFTYGTATARMRVPAGAGLWSAFWFLPADRESRPEIDVIEVYGHEPRVARLNLHVTDDEGRRVDRGTRVPAVDLSEGWHDFAIEWTPDALSWKVDGTENWRVRGDLVPREPMYPILNLAVGGDPVGPPDSESLPAELTIDHLRIVANEHTELSR
jgi:beta-glucanase (GH16 family)